MTDFRNCPIVTLMLCLGAAAVAHAADADRPVASPADLEFFEAKVRPLLAEHCFECHGPDKQKSNLRWDHIDFILAGGEKGQVIVPGQPDQSRMIAAIGYMDSDLQMPPKSRLSAGQVAVLTDWVKRGAPWPNEPKPAAIAGGAKKGFDLAERRAEHWSWRPIAKVDPPKVKDAAWPISDIDRFVLAKLEAKGLRPAPDADRRTLIRRVYLDLNGLPPTPEEVDAFVADTAGDAYERVVDRLLASERFGERWGRHWLDLVRYAESYGHEFDYNIANPWKYRDYVIGALNADVPYDKFVREHIAGDLMPEPRIDPQTGLNQSLIATGFWYLHEQTHAPTDARQHEADRIDNQIDVFSKAFLGLTVACARCHDHKFDAISTKDYYALAGYMQSSRQQEAYLDPHGRVATAINAVRAARAEAEAAIANAGPIAAREPRKEPRLDVVFDDFERDAYAPWVAEGEAFGAGPVARAAVPTYQGDLGMHGDHAVNSHASAPGSNVTERDDRIGTLASPQFTIERDHIRFLIGGGREGAALQLLVDGKVVRSAGGNDDNAMHAAEFDVADLAGRRAQLGIVDARGGGWGHIGVDHIVFTDAPLAPPAPDEPADEPDAPDDPHLIANFNTGSYAGWFTTGAAWGDRPTTDRDWDNLNPAGPALARPGLAHSGLLGPKALGTLRSPTFTLTAPTIHIRCAGKGSVRLIIDGYTMAGYNGLLFGGTQTKIERPDDTLGWITLSGDIRLNLGHTAYLEFIDDGDGFLVIDEIRIGDKAPRKGDQKLPRAALSAVDAETFAPIRERFDKAAAEVPGYERALAITDGTGEDSYVHIRGSWKSEGPTVPRRLLTALGGEDDPPLKPEDGSGRLRLVDKMFDPANPYPPRVAVNRIWHHLFGVGIVPTVDNFGVLGVEPTHPELLDFLADRFRTSLAWSRKAMIRDVVLSRTYRMSSKPTDPETERADPTDALLHRQRVRRLEGEIIRDTILAVSGRLDTKMYGDPVPVHLTAFMEGRGRPGQGPLDGAGRRSIYLSVRRNFLAPMFLTFDTPAPFSTIGARSVSNVPAQALILMNDPFVVEQAKLWATRVIKDVATPSDRIERMYAEAFGRPPEPKEIADALAFFERQAAAYGVTPEQARDDLRIWADFAHVLFNVKEFIVAH